LSKGGSIRTFLQRSGDGGENLQRQIGVHGLEDQDPAIEVLRHDPTALLRHPLLLLEDFGGVCDVGGAVPEEDGIEGVVGKGDGREVRQGELHQVLPLAAMSCCVGDQLRRTVGADHLASGRDALGEQWRPQPWAAPQVQDQVSRLERKVRHHLATLLFLGPVVVEKPLN
jgi:hypothetical protein